MKMMKRILSAAMALLVCLTAVAAMAEGTWVEDFQYRVLEDGTAEAQLKELISAMRRARPWR